MNLFNIFNRFALNATSSVAENAAETVEKISQEVMIDPSRLMGTMKHMGIGMLSIFIVIGVIIACVYLLNKTMTAIEERKAAKDAEKDN